MIKRLSEFWYWNDIKIILGLLLGVGIFCSALILAPQYLPESEYQGLPDNCTADNLKHRINQLDIIASLPIPSYKHGASNSLIVRNLHNVLRLRGCSAKINEALDGAGQSLTNLDFINYPVWRSVLIAELQTIQEEHR
jgi:hypothetical protein